MHEDGLAAGYVVVLNQVFFGDMSKIYLQLFCGNIVDPKFIQDLHRIIEKISN